MPNLSARLLTLVLFLTAGLLFQNRDAHAVQVNNKSELRIGVAILRVQGEHKTPLYIKILQPGTSCDSTPEEAGPFLLSVKVFDTDETLRLQNVQPDDVIEYAEGKLSRVEKTA